jgi:prolyl oligopeptidase
VRATTLVDGSRTWPIVDRAIDFYHSKISHIAPDGRLIPTPLPEDATIDDVIDGRVIASLKTPWQGHEAGTLVAYSITDLLAGKSPVIETVFVPNEHQAVEEVSASHSKVWVKILDDVSGRLVALTRAVDGSWSGAPAALPDKSTIHLNATASGSDLAFATVEGMLTPPTLFRAEPGAAPAVVQTLPAQFDASNMTVEQNFATSPDGTKIPYFLVRRKDVAGPAPVLMHAYGGFELAQTPGYLVSQPYRSGPLALFWVEQGNAYVLANIRGGGEYGPNWHNAVLRENRQKAYDDLYAVAGDLIARGVTEKGRLAVSGRSNGGLMAAVAITQRPDLWGGAIIGSPLIDMKRYSHLLAGASWMGEYGNPDVPGDWAFISKYSPYQNLKCGVRYPVPFIYTSTRDDRVHPGHARKLAARLEQCHDKFFYDEAIEGGHAAGIVPEEDAQRVALETVYLNLVLPQPGVRAPASVPGSERGSR